MTRLTRRFVTGMVLACAMTAAMAGATRSDNDVTTSFSGASTVLAAAQSEHGDCSRLVMLHLPDVKVTEAVATPSGNGTVKVAHCRVAGVIAKEIHFSLLLPDEWNHKFMMGGGGGFVGNVQNQAQASVNAGYATAGTDTGHEASGTVASWAQNDLERQINFGYLAVHRTTEVAKAIVRSYYGATEARSYFSGCSNGGRQALMEAQRYPDDFDGIVAGAPAYDFTGIGAQFIKDMQAAFPDPRNVSAPLFAAETLTSIEAQIVARCDALDGVKDGLLEDPRQCKADVSSLTGLTGPQRNALKIIYGETTNKDGVIYPGQPVGGEGANGGWPTWIVGVNPQLIAAQQAPSLRFAFGTEMYKYFVFNDPSWDYSRYEFSTWRKDTKIASTFLDATSPDLGAFNAKGHKLIVWHGWSDPALTALGSVRYYDQVQARDAKSGDYFRMFMMPGVLHCGGGPGPDTADWTTAIDNWVEKGTAPDRVVAQKRDAAGAVARTRPLCAYPQHAQYKGAGSIDAAENFTCSARR